MALAEYTGMTRIKGPIVLLKGIPGVGYDEVVEVTGDGGEPRMGRVVMVSEDAVMVQVFAGTEGLSQRMRSWHSCFGDDFPRADTWRSDSNSRLPIAL